jgi:hypothetical protein
MTFCIVLCSDNQKPQCWVVNSLSIISNPTAGNSSQQSLTISLILLQLFFRGKVQDEQGYVLYVRKNALQILIPKYGLEGTLYVSPKKGQKLNATFVYSEEVLYHNHV